MSFTLSNDSSSDSLNDDELSSDSLNDDEMSPDPLDDDEVSSDPLNDEEVSSDPLNDEDVSSEPLNDEEVSSDPLNDEEVSSDPLNEEELLVSSDPLNDDEVSSDPFNDDEVSSDSFLQSQESEWSDCEFTDNYSKKSQEQRRRASRKRKTRAHAPAHASSFLTGTKTKPNARKKRKQPKSPNPKNRSAFMDSHRTSNHQMSGRRMSSWDPTTNNDNGGCGKVHGSFVGCKDEECRSEKHPSLKEERIDSIDITSGGMEAKGLAACVGTSIINEREMLKESDEYKAAVQEEWPSRQRELQIQGGCVKEEKPEICDCNIYREGKKNVSKK